MLLLPLTDVVSLYTTCCKWYTDENTQLSKKAFQSNANSPLSNKCIITSNYRKTGVNVNL